MSQTTSRDYKLPGTISQYFGNIVLRYICLFPKTITKWILKQHGYYQTFEDSEEIKPGSSSAKWEALQLPANLKGKSVIDIGCAEGAFCLEAAANGAEFVMGVDARLTTLIAAKLLAKKYKMNINYKIVVFPYFKLKQKFDYLLCLSVLHHLVSTKNIWKIMVDTNYEDDKKKIINHLSFLRSLIKTDGICLVEMPYEYDNSDEMKKVDFELFSKCFLQAGFSSVRILGRWDHDDQKRKDRVIYVGNY